MPLLHFSIFKVVISYTLGIIVAHLLPSTTQGLFWWSLLLLIGATIIWQLERRGLGNTSWFAVLVLTGFFLLGFQNYQQTNPKHSAHHFSRFTTSDLPQQLVVEIKEIQKPTTWNQSYIAKVLQIENNSVDGLLLLKISHDTLHSFPYKVGQQLAITARVEQVKPNLNPYQFDYKKFLELKNIYHQARVCYDQVIIIDQNKYHPKTLASAFRTKLIAKLETSAIKPSQRSILQALLLGYKDDISEENYRNYANAGAIHILAVSGLHVGILFLVLSNILGFLSKLPRGKTIKFAIIIFLLWCFAFVAGLSPSVVRSVSMFTFFAVAGMLDRKVVPFHTLLLSFFFLLLFHPKWLFHVGFQMSYLAVFFILWLQPKLYRLYAPRFYVDKLFWSITTVSIAAQLGVAPVSIYYFKQFPGLFLLSNWVILPFLAVILVGGLLILTLLWFNILPSKAALFYDRMLYYLNEFVAWVASQEAFIFDHLHLSITKLFLVYALMLCLILILIQKSTKLLYWLIGCLFLYYSSHRKETFNNKQSQLVIFHATAKTIIGLKNQDSVYIFGSDPIISTGSYPIENYLLAQTTPKALKPLQHFFRFRDRELLIIDSSAVYLNNKADIILLRGSPKLHLDRMLDSIKPSMVIADGSNYHSFIDRWKTSCRKRKIPFHYSGEKGAFILE